MKNSLIVLTTSFPVKSQPEAGWFVHNECVYLSPYYNVKVVCPYSQNGLLDKNLTVNRFKYSFIKKESLAYGQGLANNLKHSFLAKIQLPFFFISFFFKSFNTIKRGDTIYCHWLPSLFVGVIVKKIKKNKVVYMNHHFHKNTFIYRWALKNIDLLLSNSKKNEEHTLSIFPVKTHYINYIGVNKNIYKPNIVNKETNSFNILCVGRFIELKGHILLLNAINTLKEKHKIKLTLVGDGPLKQNYVNFIKTNKLEKIVSLIGPLKKDDVVPYYQSSDLFVLPTLKTKELGQEGLGTALIEASMCGVPVVASDSGGIKEVVEKCKNGIIVAPNDEKKLTFAIESLITTPTLLNPFFTEKRFPIS